MMELVKQVSVRERVGQVWIMVLIAGASGLCHVYIKDQYHRQCDQHLLKVLFFKNSQLCQLMEQVIDVIENVHQGVFWGVLKKLNFT